MEAAKEEEEENCQISAPLGNGGKAVFFRKVEQDLSCPKSFILRGVVQYFFKCEKEKWDPKKYRFTTRSISNATHGDGCNLSNFPPAPSKPKQQAHAAHPPPLSLHFKNPPFCSFPRHARIFSPERLFYAFSLHKLEKSPSPSFSPATPTNPNLIRSSSSRPPA